MTREQNIKAVLECVFSESKEELIDIAVNNIMAIKSLEQDRPIGHWEHYEPLPSEWGYKCSICENPERSNGHRYCCNCGAKMVD